MPYAPLKPCCQPGCGELCEGRYCIKHKRVRFAELDARIVRGSSASRGYGGAHRRLRIMVLHRDPICKDCGRAPATVADHIIAKRNGGTSTLSNMQGVCASCHARKTLADTGALKTKAPHALGTRITTRACVS